MSKSTRNGHAARTKDPVFVEAGRKAARVRWGPPRILRLDSLSEAQRELISAILAASPEGAPDA